MGQVQWRNTEGGGPWPKCTFISHRQTYYLQTRSPLFSRIMGPLQGLLIPWAPGQRPAWPNGRYAPDYVSFCVFMLIVKWYKMTNIRMVDLKNTLWGDVG